jgi:Flp pilus assembly protein TadD
MRASLRQLDRGQDRAPELPPVDEAAAERLAALGYVGGSSAPGPTASGVDLKDRIADVQRYTRGMRDGLRLYREGQHAAAARLLGRVAATSPPSFNVQYYLGRSLLDAGRPAEAIPHLRKAAEMAPARRSQSGLAAAPVYAWLVEAYAAAGRVAEAVRTLDGALAASPANAELLRARGSLLLRRGDLAGARAALEQARALSAREPRLHLELSNVYRNLGELAPATAAAREAVRLEARSPDAHVALGLATAALGSETEAARSFRRALRLSPDHADALFYLGAVELRAGRATTAAPLLERLVATSPDYPQARETLALARRLLAAAR